MRMPHCICVSVSLLALAFAFSAPAFAAEGRSVGKVPAAKASKPVSSPGADSGSLQKDLDVFAISCVAKMNEQMMPGIKSKQVVRVPEGYQAKYTAVDPNSLTTSYRPSEHKIVPYVGRMMYHEVEYVCVGKTREEALAGPFSEVTRRPMTELIKYMKGKWTY